MRTTLVVAALTSALSSYAPALAQTIDDTTLPMESAAVSEPFRLDLGALQDEPATIPAEPEDDWRVDVTAWIWLNGMSGDIRTGPITADVDAGFSDILDASDSLFAFTGRLEVGKGRWAGFIEGMYADIGADDQTGLLGLATVDVSTEIVLLDFGVLYRAWDQVATNGGGRSHAIDLYVGGRYQALSAELDPVLLAARTKSKNWLDPILGMRATIQLAKRFDFTVVGDIGGFGVGSDLTWSARGVFGYHFECFDMPSTIYAGYAALGTDYSDGSGLQRFEWDMILHGPVLGISFSF